MAISTSAHAYIDPVTGSLIIQGLIAAVVGALAMIKFQYARIKSFFRKVFGRSKEASIEDNKDDKSDNNESHNQEEEQGS